MDYCYFVLELTRWGYAFFSKSLALLSGAAAAMFSSPAACSRLLQLNGESAVDQWSLLHWQRGLAFDPDNYNG